MPKLEPKRALAGLNQTTGKQISFDKKKVGDIIDELAIKFSKNSDEVGSGVKIGGAVDEVDDLAIKSNGISPFLDNSIKNINEFIAGKNI